jgi:hypothetical protein
MKLISITDYVLNSIEKVGYGKSQVEFVATVRAYANFLKQPLNLGMFIPCDENGNVVEYPDHNYNSMEYMDEFDVYNEAKNRVLFEGFEIRNKNNFYFIEKKESSVYFRILKNTTKTIEDLIPVWLEVLLTQSAIKQLI